ncbi:PQQ-binding-like beta-propeller repeat protein [bacterium]|nr:PQQ-binding-like beta-propeller repeat protein [bacterium]
MLFREQIAVCLLFISIGTISANAENWPGWRGPTGDGISSEKDLPLEWDGVDKNLVWKVPLPGEGYSSPIVWGDRIFVTTCLPDSQERVLMCLSTQSGKILWQQTVVTAPLETLHKFNSHSSGTPVSDGKLVYVAFLEVDGTTVDAKNVGKARPVTAGEIVVAAYDFNGRAMWKAKPGGFVSVHGFCSCPVLYKDKVIINGDHDGDSYIAALNKETGQLLWKKERDHDTRSYVTPIIREIDGRTQMVLSGSHHVASYDPNTGEEHWRIDGPTEQFVASMVYDNEKFYLSAGFPTYHVMAIDPTGSGNVTDTHVAWHETNAKCYVPSPVLVGNYLFVADDHGIGNCFDTKTGERLWRARLGRHFSTSLVAADGLVYFLDDDGRTTVIRPGKEPGILTVNGLGEECRASPAIADGRFYFRGVKHLFCIGEK